MRKYDVQIALEGVAEARTKWAAAKREFDAGVNKVIGRLLHEAAANFMNVEDVAKFSGLKVGQVRSMMRLHGLNPNTGKTLLAQTAAEALASNSSLLGIAPHEMDLMSPLAYLPMGSAMRQELQDQSVSKVTELPEEHVHTSACAVDRPCPDDTDAVSRNAVAAMRARVLTIHRPSTDHGVNYDPYCIGCWEAGGQDGAPSYPCETALVVL